MSLLIIILFVGVIIYFVTKSEPVKDSGVLGVDSPILGTAPPVQTMPPAYISQTDLTGLMQSAPVQTILASSPPVIPPVVYTPPPGVPVNSILSGSPAIIPTAEQIALAKAAAESTAKQNQSFLNAKIASDNIAIAAAAAREAAAARAAALLASKNAAIEAARLKSDSLKASTKERLAEITARLAAERLKAKKNK